MWRRAVIGRSWRSCISCQTEGGSSGAQEEVLRCGGCHLTPGGPQQRGTQWTLPLPTPLRLTRRLTGRRVSETADVASLVPPNRTRLNIWSNSDIHFDIVQRREEKKDCSFSPQSPMVLSVFPSSCYQRNNSRHVFQGIDIVHKRAVCFPLFSMFMLLLF